MTVGPAEVVTRLEEARGGGSLEVTFSCQYFLDDSVNLAIFL